MMKLKNSKKSPKSKGVVTSTWRPSARATSLTEATDYSGYDVICANDSNTRSLSKHIEFFREQDV